MLRYTAQILLWAGLMSSAVQADFFVQQATFELADAGQPALAASPDGWTMLAYHAKEKVILMSFVHTQLVPTRATDTPYDWPPPQLINNGHAPEVCWSREGFTLAMASGDAVLIYQSDLAGNWDRGNYELIFPGGAVMGLDLWGVASDAAGPHVYLTITTSHDPPDRDNRVLFASRSAGGWSGLTELAQQAELTLRGQVTWSRDGYDPWPTVYFLGHDLIGPTLYSRTHTETGWNAPLTVPLDPMPLDGEFDVVTLGSNERHILGLGPQPTCPCGTIHYLSSAFPGGWGTENLTRDYGYMDWPMSPKLDIDPDGRVHAFWYQQSSGDDLVPHRRDLEYWIRDGDAWTDAGGFLDDQPRGPLGERVALDASSNGGPILAWTRRDTSGGEPQPRQVWIARMWSTLSTPDLPLPQAAVALSAWPNPFNPRVTLVVEVAAPESATLSIFDARGRCVRQLLDAAPVTDRRELVWDGTDAAGRELPSGVYFARVVTPTSRVTRKLVLAR